MAAAGKQAARNARHKPDAVAEASSGGGRSRSKVTSQLGMSLEEAHLILNTKKTDNMETIMANYERIFKANSPPEAPKPPPAAKEAVGAAAQAAAAQAARAAKKAPKGPTHSHYLQSKVYRALERIKAEAAAEGAAAEGAAAEAAAAEGAAAEAAAEGAAKAEAKAAEGAKKE
ncbi:hypothetical protein A1Q2_03542 [Trichosporon asahii var. asahii CBS 8904]|uniref:Mitochondrial import inner membrane translocase subunit TIM16 n=1 Tax=Trichosporon asahii var. asahii (strain CBS 8904) TaxID=1220162 RepID=K1VDY5_TRIAC|nr:hypothetical protein A1Q2_03542 [Trichosporon asahii var. asahii CBS 8904]